MSTGTSFRTRSEGAQQKLLHLEHARAPYAIELSAEVVPRMLAAVKAAEKLGCEAGGLLIGSFPRAPVLTVRIEDFVLLERRADDNEFELSIEQRARLSTMRHRLVEQQRRVVGFFRSHLRKEKMILSSADRELAAAEFGRAIHVALLIQAEPPYPSAFFLPDADGTLQAGPPLPEFQFTAEEMARLAPRTAGPISAAAAIAAPAASDLAASTNQSKSGLRVTGAWLAIVLMICLSLTLWAPLTARLLFAGGGLRLTVQPRGGMLELRWNRRQLLLSRAASAILTIDDSGVEHRLELTPAQIREGRIAYRPAGNRISFRLSVPLPDSAELTQAVAIQLPAHQ